MVAKSGEDAEDFTGIPLRPSGRAAAPVLAGRETSFHDAGVKETIVRRQLLAGAVGLLALRLVLALPRTGPLLLADESGYLANARALTGGAAGQLEGAPFYHAGYSLLIAPLVALGAGPTTTYRLILALNAALAAALVPLLYLLLTRCFRIAPRVAVLPAIAAAAYPTITLLSQVAMSENLLVPLVVVWLLCCGGLFDAGSRRAQSVWGAALGACTLALYVTHGRMIVAVALTVGALVVLSLRRRIPVSPTVIALAVMAAGYPAMRRLNDFLVSTNWAGRAPNEAGERLSGLGDVGALLSVARNLVGQTWYVMGASLGVIVVFAVGGGLRGLTTVRRRDAGTPELVLALTLATGAALLGLSALSFRVVERPDMFIYGRYVEVIVPPLLAVALARLPALRGSVRPLAALGAVGLTTAAVVVLRLGLDPPRGPNRWNVASLPFPTFGLGIPVLLGAGVVAAVAAVVAGTLVRRAPALLAPALLLAFVPTTAVSERNPAFSGQRDAYGNGWESPGPALHNAPVVAYDMDAYDIYGLYAYQWFMGHSRFVVFRSSSEDPTARYVISSHTWGERHRRLRRSAVWSDPNRDQTVFRLDRRQPP